MKIRYGVYGKVMQGLKDRKMKPDRISRRSFVRKSAISGMASLAPLGIIASSPSGQTSVDSKAREVWIAGVSQMSLSAATPKEMSRKILEILKGIVPYKPDFVCLPEAFPFTFIKQQLNTEEKTEISEEILEQYSGFSGQNNCYTICPVYTRADGAIYNSAVIFDRSGKRTGVYNKIHPTEGEIEEGISPGALFQTAIPTEYGPAGVQICFDINWNDGWDMLKQQGAKIVFWPSAYAGGITINTRAWQHKCIIASSTQKNTSRLCDITGETITRTGIWDLNLYCGSVNMEKAFLATWPYVMRFDEIRKKYGRKVKITSFHEEEWTIIESLSPEIAVSDILKEFDLKTYDEHIASAGIVQNKTRKSGVA